MRLLARRALTALAIFVSGPAVADVAAADSDPACSMDKMERDPASVIAPCSALLNEQNLSPEQRAEALFVRGRGYHRTGRPDIAALDYDDALKLNPNNDEIYVSRANVAARQGLLDVAEAYLRVALKINPKNAHALRAMGLISEDGKRFRYYSQALAVDPAEPYALLFRSQIYAYNGRYDKAFKDADALVAIPPDIINRQGYVDWQSQMRDFHVIALKHRAGLYEEIGKYDLALRDLNAAVNYRAVPEAFIARGEFLWKRRGHDDDALKDLDAAIALDPNDARAHDLRGMVLVRLRRPELALQAFDQAIRHDPDDAYALHMRARMHRELGQTDEAVRDFETAIRIDPEIGREAIPALLAAGYWTSKTMPEPLTPEFRDAIRACMLDKTCN
jgi:tetratricopeptide (TPR) repeat protein